MALYVMRPDNPPIGEDWQAAVPGQYLYNVTGVYATLTTGAAGDVLADESGNDNDGTYAEPTPFGAFVPGILAGKTAWQPNAAPGTPAFDAADIPHPLCTWSAPFTVAWWQRYDASEVGGGTSLFVTASNTVSAGFQIAGTATNGAPGSQPLLVAPPGGAWVAPETVLIADGAIHHVALVYDGGTGFDLYVDAVLVPWAIAVPAFPTAPVDFTQFGNPDIGAGTFQSFAVFPTALSSGDIATLYAAGLVDADTYNAEVLMFAPTALYFFDGPTASTGRQVTLSITDSNNETERIPSGFDVLATPGPYAWSWLPTLNSAAENATSKTITVPLPKLLLPAGYTIGTKTLDLAPTDQWSDIAIWWNSDVMDASQELNPYAYPPGATLVYRQIQGTP